MAITVEAIYRYPIKGFSPEPLQRVPLSTGECLPHDREYAIALPSTRFDPERPKWIPKTCFVMLMRDEALARLNTRLDHAKAEIVISEAGREVFRGSLRDACDSRRLGDFIADFLGDTVERPLRLVQSPGHAFADARPKPNATTEKYVSLINRESIAALEQAMGTTIDPLRFRANFYFSGTPAWSELDWMESILRVGQARLRVIANITRCAATQVNLATAERDLDIPVGLQRHFGHNLMGIYAEVVTLGDVAVGDRLSLEPR